MAIFLQDGKYRIEKSLGQGGFGITYLATQVNLNRQVAIKEFYPKDFCDTSQVRLTPKPGDEELVARFKRKFISEARNVAKLDHPNIVKIYDVFEENSTAYFVMEYVEGESLDAMAKRGAMSEADALHYIIPIARALEYVHSENMTHLDVKPANIMVRRKNNTPVLIDFGLAKQYDRTTGGETSTSFVGLSPGYAPIEQYNQGGVNTFSPQIDVYALGATLYRLVTGTTPPEPTMREGNDVEISTPVSVGTRNAIQHAMRMFKSNRTPSMTAFIAELSATPTPETQPQPQQPTPAPQPQTRILPTQPQPTPQPIEDDDDEKEKEKSNLGLYIKNVIIAVVVIGFIIFLLNRCNSNAPHEDIPKTEAITEEDSALVVVEVVEPDKAEDMFTLGQDYYYGRGVEKDYAKAVEWYRKAAEQGYAPAQYRLGECYHNCIGIVQDYAKAVEWYRKAAEQGDAQAQCNLGQCYYDGEGVEQDYAKAVEWFRKAAVQGNARAQCHLGNCYEWGRGVKQDYAKAVEWFRKAAVQGNARAQCHLGICYEFGKGVEHDYAKAVEWFRKAAVQGNAQAQCNLGQCYYDGEGVEQDYAKAVEWYQKAAKQRYAPAQNNLGICYEVGRGVEQDYAKAVEWYHKAAVQGYVLAQVYLGYCYKWGRGVKQDYAKAVEWFRKAADQRYALAQYLLGDCYEKGLGVAKNRYKAVEWYQKAAEQGNKDAKKRLRDMGV